MLRPWDDKEGREKGIKKKAAPPGGSWRLVPVPHLLDKIKS